MKAIAACIIFGLLVTAIGLLFSGHVFWLLPIAILAGGSFQRLFVWLFIDPDDEKRRRHLITSSANATGDQNNPSI